MGDHADALEFAGAAPSPTVLLVSSLKILAVTLPEVSTLPTSATTRRASSTQRRGLMNCSEQISVAQRRTAALLLHARCRDVAPKDLPSARFATLERQKLRGPSSTRPRIRYLGDMLVQTQTRKAPTQHGKFCIVLLNTQCEEAPMKMGATSISFRPKVFSDPASVVD